MSTMIFIADLHLDIEELERISDFILFLDFFYGTNTKIYILGDLFNFWAGKGQSKLNSLRPLLEAMKRISEYLYFLPGNRDFLFPYYWKSQGGNVVIDGEILEQANTRAVLYHGDSLCTNDIRYHRMKYWLQSRLVYYLSGIMPSGLCIKAAQKLRTMSKKAVRLKDSQEMGLSIPSVKKVLELSRANFLICGHVHRAEILNFSTDGKKIQAYVLPENKGRLLRYLAWNEDNLEFVDFNAFQKRPS